MHRVSTWLERHCYDAAWLVTGQSREIIADIRARFPKSQTYHLSNGVDCGAFGAERATADARATLGGDGRCVVLYAGLHGIAQGLDQVIDAAAAMRGEDGPDFVLVGDGPVKAQLVADAERRQLQSVRFLAARPADALPPLLAAADILVVPLGLGIPGAVPSKLYEAMASARPIVLVASGEPASIVQTHRAGLVVAPKDTDALAGALRRLRDNPSLRAELGENGRRAAERFFDRAEIAREFILHLQNALTY
jgi:glycosyltransferase involved in cell wall biosynthesis